MKIVVLAKQVPDTYGARQLSLESGLLERDASERVPDEVNERAVECALQYKDKNPDTQVVLLAMGPDDTATSLRKLLAMGADEAVLVSDAALVGSDAVQTARVLAGALERLGADLVLAGNETTDGRAGVVPAMIAELMSRSLLPSVDDLVIDEDSVSGTLQVDGGSMALRAGLPALASITEKAAEPRFPNFKNIMAAKKKPLEVLSLADLGVEAGQETSHPRSVMVSATKRPPRQAGPKVTDDGSAVGQLVDFLASRNAL